MTLEHDIHHVLNHSSSFSSLSSFPPFFTHVLSYNRTFLPRSNSKSYLTHIHFRTTLLRQNRSRNCAEQFVLKLSCFLNGSDFNFQTLSCFLPLFCFATASSSLLGEGLNFVELRLQIISLKGSQEVRLGKIIVRMNDIHSTS